MTLRTNTLFTAHDDGLIRLPPALLTLRDAHASASADLVNLTAPTHYLDEQARLAQETVEAYISGGPVPTVDPVLDAERESRAFEHRLEVGRSAVNILETRLNAAIAEQVDDLIADALRPVFDATVAAMREAYDLLEPFENAGRGALALAAAKVRKAAAELDGKHVPTYTTLRDCARELRRLSPPAEYDRDDEFAAFTDIHRVWPIDRRTGIAATRAPWADAPDPQAWQLRNLTPWLPTRAEQDAEWLKVYGEQLKQQRVDAEKRRAMALTFGHGH